MTAVRCAAVASIRLDDRNFGPYLDVETAWSKPGSSRTIAGDEAVFRDINAANKMEGGPNGIVIYQDRLAICSPEFGVNIYRFREGRRRSWLFR